MISNPLVVKSPDQVTLVSASYLEFQLSGPLVLGSAASLSGSRLLLRYFRPAS